MFNFLKKTEINGGIFNGHFVDAKALYVARFNKIPCLTFIGDMDVSKAFAFIAETYARDVSGIYQHSYFNHDDGEVYFNNCIVVLNHKRMIEIADNYCQVLHDINQHAWVKQLMNDLAQFRMTNAVDPVYRHIHVAGFAKTTDMN